MNTSFLESKIWRVVKRRNAKEGDLDYPGRLISVIDSGLDFRAARKLKRELNQLRNPYEKLDHYYCMERIDK